jgi:serine/threonine protein phosphatase PrpC
MTTTGVEAVMAEHWYYCGSDAQVRGPVSPDRVRQLVATGELKADVEIWADKPERDQATEVRKAGELGAPATATGVPDWVSDVASSEEAAKAQEKTSELDWLADVEVPATPLVEQLEEVAEEQHPPAVDVEAVAPQAGQPDRFSTGGATSRGLVRPRNEDCFLVQHFTWSSGDDCHDVALLIVADGMGGHQAGDKASSLAVRTMASTLAPALAGMLHGPNREAGATVLGRHLDQALQEAHSAVLRRGESDPTCKGMGATVVVAIVWDDLALIRHVGDCRAYHLHGGHLLQITRDQTLVNRMVDLGKLTPEEAATHPDRNQVLQALGQTPIRGRAPTQPTGKVADVDFAESFRKLEPSEHRLRFQPGDRLVLTCDGLGAHVAPEALEEAVAEWRGSAESLARHLVDLANAGGGTDNCTVVVVTRD